jgi:Outer membrane lipoprotein-sorting protein
MTALPATVAATILVAVLLPHTSARQRPAEGRTPEWVARQVRDRDTGKDSRSEMRMRLFDRQGRVRERVMTLTTLRGLEKGQRADRTLIRFQYPNDIKGTSFLVIEHPDADDERFLYLPALGRVRRIAGEEKQESFVGSDFTYEDIGGREIDDYTYRFVDERATWKGPDGKAWPASRLESRAKDPKASYPRSVSLVLDDIFVVVEAESVNQRNEPAKAFAVSRLDRVEGIWTVMEMAMKSLREKTRTELVVSSVDYNIGLSEADFSKRELERGAR